MPHILEKFAAKAAAALTTVYVLDVIARHAVKVPDAQKLMERFREKLTTIFRWVVPSDVQEKVCIAFEMWERLGTEKWRYGQSGSGSGSEHQTLDIRHQTPSNIVLGQNPPRSIPLAEEQSVCRQAWRDRAHDSRPRR